MQSRACELPVYRRSASFAAASALVKSCACRNAWHCFAGSNERKASASRLAISLPVPLPARRRSRRTDADADCGSVWVTSFSRPTTSIESSPSCRITPSTRSRALSTRASWRALVGSSGMSTGKPLDTRFVSMSRLSTALKRSA